MIKEKERILCPDAVFLYGRCENCDKGVFLMGGGCDKEVCPACGQVGSGGHLKRYKRWIGKALWMLKEYEAVGYMVVTLPNEYWKRDREFLKKFRRYIIRKLGREGIKVGKVRYHWAGDRNKCFYPHLNILMAGGWLDKERLEGIKEDVAKRLKFDGGKVVIDYHYTKNIGKIRHWVWYITRPTLLLIEDEEERLEVWEECVKNFRNDVEWGRPKSIELAKDKEDLKILKEALPVEEYKKICLLNNVCPYCGGKIRWKFSRDRPDEFWLVISDNLWEWRL